MCHRSLKNLTSYHERFIGNTYRWDYMNIYAVEPRYIEVG
jgi:hypothetical protein